MVGACQQNSGIFLVKGGGAGQGPDEMPTGAEAGLAADRCWVEADAGGAEAGTERDADDQITGAGNGKNQLKIKRSIISSSNSGFSKSFSLVMIKLLCSQNPASW